MFEKRHYEWLARWARKYTAMNGKAGAVGEEQANMIQSLSWALQQQSFKFRRDKFIKACGIDGKEP